MRWRFRVPRRARPLHRAEGLVAVDGVSLTVNEVEGDIFGVTSSRTPRPSPRFGTCSRAIAVNIEIDMLARYVARLRGDRAMESHESA